MNIFILLRDVLSGIFLILALVPIAYLSLLTLAALLPRSGRKVTAASPHRFLVVIPAHNESLLIGETVTGAYGQKYPREQFEILVIADHCSDNTAEIAQRCGARVMTRSRLPGKGQALFEAFETIKHEGWDAVLVIDADTAMHPNLLARLSQEIHLGAKAIQVFYGVLNPGESKRTAAMEWALASFNGLRPRGKSRLGWSAGLFGNGFVLTNEILNRVPYTAGSIVEDLEYHAHLLDAGYSVTFLDDVWVKAQMPVSAEQSKSQRVRWERGRFALIAGTAPRLLGRMIRGRWRLGQALVDICILPVSFLCLFLVLGGLLGTGWLRILAFSGLLMLMFHYAIAALRFGDPGRSLRVGFYVPWYLFWKVLIVVWSFVKQRKLGWIRTQRH